MRIINEENLNYEFLVETLDDLWVLSQFVVEGDILEGKTERKIKISTGGENYKVTRKLIFVKLFVKQVKLEGTVLRVQGEILNETEFTNVGANHTLSYNLGSKIFIIKKNLLKFEKKLIDSAVNSKKNHNLLVLVDKDEMVVSEFTNMSFSVFLHKTGLGNKKYYKTLIDEEEEKLETLKNYLERNYNNIIISGPGIYKDKLIKKVKDKLGVSCKSFQFFGVGPNFVQKCINKVNKSNLIVDTNISYEQESVEELLKNINLDEKYVYGFEGTVLKIQMGAVDKLLVSTKFIDLKKDEGSYLELNEFFKLVEDLNGKLIILNSKFEPGKILDGLGGIGGVLRY